MIDKNKIQNYTFQDILIVDYYWTWEDVLFPALWTYAKIPDIIENWYKIFDKNKILNLPDKKEWYYFIVKDIIAILCYDRDDLLITAEPVYSKWRWYYKKLVPIKLIR